jgi:hypothetical protein
MSSTTSDASRIADAPSNGARRRLAIEAQAEFVRARLQRAVEMLRDRKRLLLDPAEEARRHPAAALAAAGSAVVVLGAGALLFGYRISTRTERVRRRRMEAWMRLVRRPESVALAPPLSQRLLERAVAAVLTTAITALGKRWLEARPSSTRA